MITQSRRMVVDGVVTTGADDSTMVLLIDRRTGATDTVARTANVPMRMTQRSNAAVPAEAAGAE